MAKITNMIIGGSHAELVVNERSMGIWRCSNNHKVLHTVRCAVRSVFAIIVTRKHFDGNASWKSARRVLSSHTTIGIVNTEELCKFVSVLLLFSACVGSWSERTKTRQIESKIQTFLLGCRCCSFSAAHFHSIRFSMWSVGCFALNAFATWQNKSIIIVCQLKYCQFSSITWRNKRETTRGERQPSSSTTWLVLLFMPLRWCAAIHNVYIAHCDKATDNKQTSSMLTDVDTVQMVGWCTLQVRQKEPNEKP